LVAAASAVVPAVAAAAGAAGPAAVAPSTASTAAAASTAPRERVVVRLRGGTVMSIPSHTSIGAGPDVPGPGLDLPWCRGGAVVLESAVLPRRHGREAVERDA
jgi:hypothetical protein